MSGKIILIKQEVLLRVFFFQAEDGIRDGRVTGVQTCALPISNVEVIPMSIPERSISISTKTIVKVVLTIILLMFLWAVRDVVGLVFTALILAALRSEERRVGKECRSRGSPDQFIKTRHEVDSG